MLYACVAVNKQIIHSELCSHRYTAFLNRIDINIISQTSGKYNTKIKRSWLCHDRVLVEKVFFDKLSGFEKHTQTRKKPPSAYKGTVGGF